MDFKRPPARVLANIVRSIGFEHLKPIAPPPQEALPRWRRIAEGLAAQQDPRRRGDPPPLRRLEHVLRVGARPVDDLHLRVLPAPRRDAGRGAGEQVPAGVREAAAEAGRPAARRRLRLGRHGALRRPPRREGDRRHAVARSRRRGRRRRSPSRACPTSPRSATATTATSRETGFDAVSSIGLTEHIGVHNYPSYFRFLQSKMRTGALLLNHCITRPDNRTGPSAGGFIDRYVFPDGELTGSGRIITEAQDVGLEVRARGEPAPPLRADAARLVPQPRRALGRGGRRGRAAHREGVGPLHGRVAAGLRDAMSFSCTRCWRSSSTRDGSDGGLPLRPWWTP